MRRLAFIHVFVVLALCLLVGSPGNVLAGECTGMCGTPDTSGGVPPLPDGTLPPIPGTPVYSCFAANSSSTADFSNLAFLFLPVLPSLVFARLRRRALKKLW